MKKIYIILLAGLLLNTSCENWLSEYPTKGTNEPVQRLEQLVALLETTQEIEQSGYTETASTDNYEIPMWLYDATPSNFAVAKLNYYTFNVPEIIAATRDGFWSDFYNYIYMANLVLEYVDKVSGDATAKQELKAEAHFLRAYNNFMLANFYCMPYAPENFEELGLPRKVTIDAEESLVRMNLQDTYAFIEEDIAEGLKVSKEDCDNTWRFNNKATMNAVLSRYYLYIGEYEKAITAADYAMTHAGIVSLKDYATLVAGTPAIYKDPADTIKYCETHDYAQPQYVKWPEFFFARYNYNSTGWLVASPGLLSLYDKNNDWRFKWFFLDLSRRYNYNSMTNRPIYSYVGFLTNQLLPSGPSIQEVMLNKAEALVRKSTPDITGAMALVNQLRDKRIKAGAPGIHLSASSVDDALVKVLEERRRELPFAHRWFDIRRFAYTPTTVDDVAITRTFYKVANGVVNKNETGTYSLPLKSRRYAVPVTGTEVMKTQGQFKQNTY